MESFNWMILIFVLFWLQLFTIFHELGHAYFMLLFSNQTIYIIIGDWSETGMKLNFGRLRIIINNPILLGGICKFENQNYKIDSKIKNLLIAAGGPLVNFIF